MKTFQLWVRVIRWVDGDTFVGICDHGARIYMGTEAKPIRFRCALINAPELPTPEGIAAADYARSLVPPGEYQAVSTGLDEYGRPLLDIQTDRGLFSTLMLGTGNAVPYKR